MNLYMESALGNRNPNLPFSADPSGRQNPFWIQRDSKVHNQKQ